MPARVVGTMGILKTTPGRVDAWATTRWSTVAKLADRKAPTWESDWRYLVEAYRAPLERYAQRLLARMAPGGDSAADAEDLVQSFLSLCIEKGWLARAEPGKGRFRAFLQTLLKRHAIKAVRHRLAQRRHPGAEHAILPLLDEGVDEDPSLDDSRERQEFDRDWVCVLVEQTLRRLTEEHEKYAAVIRDLILTHGEGSPDLDRLLGVHAQQLPVIRHRARERFARLFEKELAATVASQRDFEDEWRALQAFLP